MVKKIKIKINEQIILQNNEHDDNINLYIVD